MSPTSQPRDIVAIGDIHGECTLLRRFLDGIDTLAAEKHASPAIFLLGDLVDRGKDSCGVLDLAEEILATRPGSKMLLGNHDEWLLRFLKDELSLEETFSWLDQGGAETLASYGHSTSSHPRESRLAILRDKPGHLILLEQASPIILVGDFAFVHAGVDPSRPLTDQRRHDCIWIRAPFMNHVGRLSHLVLHGHTPQKRGRPTVTENRLSLDTGAVFTGFLTGAWVDTISGSVTCLQASLDRKLHKVEPRRLDRGLGIALSASHKT